MSKELVVAPISFMLVGGSGLFKITKSTPIREGSD
jgi:hypothetical protein